MHRRGRLAVPASATAAETVTPLPLATFHAIAVDDQTGRIFVSGDAAGGGSAVIVAGFDGAISTQITDLPGASGLALSGSLLYVARCGDHEIEVVDTVSPQMIGSIDTGASIGGDCHIAVASGRIWFLSAAGAISSVEVAAPHAPATYPGLGSFTVPVLAAGGSRLVLADTDTPLGVGAGPQVHVYDVGGPAPQLEIEGYPDNTGYSQGNFADASLSADGSKLLLSGAPLMLVDPATLHPLVVYKRPIRGVLYPMSVGSCRPHAVRGLPWRVRGESLDVLVAGDRAVCARRSSVRSMESIRGRFASRLHFPPTAGGCSRSAAAAPPR